MTFSVMEAQSSDEAVLARTDATLNDLRFQIDRTIQFMHQYAMMVTQGVRHYQKFEKMIGHYEKDIICTTRMPSSFEDLKFEISNTLSKFENAYMMSELQGSKYKALLYGMN